MHKEFVDVIVKFQKDGQKIPITVIWDDGTKYEIDKILDVRRAVSMKVGGLGIRYECKILGKITYLWLEDDVWFVEAK